MARSFSFYLLEMATVDLFVEYRFNVPLGLIIIDTASLAFAMAQENDNAEIALYLTDAFAGSTPRLVRSQWPSTTTAKTRTPGYARALHGERTMTRSSLAWANAIRKRRLHKPPPHRS